MIVEFEDKIISSSNLQINKASFSKIDPSQINNIITIHKVISSLLKFSPLLNSEEENEVLLEFDLKSLHQLNIDDFVSEISKNALSVNPIILNQIFLFVATKYISQLSGMITNSYVIFNRSNFEDTLTRKINSELLSYTGSLSLMCYRYKLFGLNLDRKYENIFREKESYIKNFTLNQMVADIKGKILNLGGVNNENIQELFINQLSFIHFNEYLKFIEKKSNDEIEKMEISILQLNLLLGYFTWRNILEVNINDF